MTAPTGSVSPLTLAARHDLYGDAFNEAVFHAPGQDLSRTMVYVRQPPWSTAALWRGLGHEHGR
jgi:hypothetical protein